MVSLVDRPNGSCYEPRPSVFEADLAGEPAYLHETSYRAQLYWKDIRLLGTNTLAYLAETSVANKKVL